MKCLKYLLWGVLIGVVYTPSLVAVEDWFSQKRVLPSIDTEEGRRRLIAFRNFRYEGDICLNFTLTNMPRNGGREIYNGTLWSTWNDQGPITRIELMPLRRDQQPIRLLIQNGPKPQIWYLGAGNKAIILQEQDWFKPLLDNIVYTPFELSLSFLFWPEFTYEGPKRVKGRSAQLFVMLPPFDITRANPNLGGVHIAMDTEYNVLLQADQLDRNGSPLRSIKLNSFKKVGCEYIIKELDVVDNISKDKTRFEVISAALCLSIDDSYFAPESLALANPEVSREFFSVLR